MLSVPVRIIHPSESMLTTPPDQPIDEATPDRDELTLVAEARSEPSFAAVFEASPFAMSLTEMPSGRIIRVNHAFEELFDFGRDELLGRTSLQLEIFDPESQAEVTRRFEADGVVRDAEVVRTAHDGRRRTLSINLDWVTLGEHRFVLTSIRDVTEQRRAEQALAVSERRYRDIVQTTADGILIGDPHGIITFVNQRMADMLGYGAGELVGMPGTDLIYPDWLPSVMDNREALSQGDVLRGEFKLRRKDGLPLWTMFSSSPLRDDVGAHIGNLTLHTDISDRKDAEEALRRSEERFRGVFESHAAAIALTDREGRLVLANQVFADLLGYRREELVGLGVEALTHPEDLERERPLMDDLLEGAISSYHMEKRYLRKDGSPVWVELEAGVLRDAQERPEHRIVFARDLSPRRANQARLRASEKTLRSFYDSVSLLMGVAELDGEHLVPVSGNRAAEELLGGRLAVQPGSGAAAAAAGDPGRLEDELVRHYRESGRLERPVRFECELKHGGDSRLLSFTVAHIGRGSGGRPRFSFVGEDITERRRVELALRDQQVEQAARDERSRLARDLHDSVTQALFAASLKAEALTGMDVALAVEEIVTEVRRLNRGALAQMRTMLLELRGDPLERIPLQQLLRNVVEATESRTRTSVSLVIEGDTPPPAALHVTLYRVAQEALNNVARHAQAANAWVELRLRHAHVRLSVRDDGRGFDPGPIGPQHMGLRSMQERAREAGAEFRLTSSPGAGTEVVVEWVARAREVDTSPP
jgi:PAS domain S-box-containing protein